MQEQALAALSELVRQAAAVYLATGHPVACSLGPVLLESLSTPSTGAVVEKSPEIVCLDEVFQAAGTHPIVSAVAPVTGHLRWVTAKAMQAIPATRDRHAYTEIVGPDGVFRSQVIRFGLYFQAPGTAYPDHDHAAEELYFVVAGTAGWRKGQGRPVPRPPGTLIHHLPYQTHATTTRDEPLLAMWAWTGEISTDSYRVAGIAGL